MEKKDSNKPDISSFSLARRIYKAYCAPFKFVAKLFHRRRVNLVAKGVGIFFTEPIKAVATLHHCHIGNVSVEHFHHFDLNPEQVSYFEKPEIALLMVPGKLANQGVWRTFAKKLKEENPMPVFTLNMPEVMSFSRNRREVEKDETEAVHRRILEIKQLYINHGKAPPKLIIVGHAKGAQIALEACGHDNDVKKIVGLGHVFDKKHVEEDNIDKLFEIKGNTNIFSYGKSALPKESQVTVNGGYYGLLYSKEVQDIIVKFVRDLNP